MNGPLNMRIITQWLSKICQKACNFLVNHDATWYMINKSSLDLSLINNYFADKKLLLSLQTNFV